MEMPRRSVLRLWAPVVRTRQERRVAVGHSRRQDLVYRSGLPIQNITITVSVSNATGKPQR